MVKAEIVKKEDLAATKKKIAKAEKPKKVKTKRKQSSLFVRIVILAIIDLLCIIILVWLLSKLPEQAEELRGLRSLQYKASLGDIKAIEKEIATKQEKTDKLNTFFPDEIGLIDFVKEIDKFKNEGIVTNFSFVSDKVVKDKTRVLGLPLVIEFRGNWPEVDKALQKIQKLPFLIRAVNIEVKKIPDSESINLKYGGVLYVNESFYKD